ncbi:type IV pilin protein [Pseudomonas sp. RIT-PI-S]|uniref:type IV pilin protein n=1 Tax=Pseudomonas sp. RIT-PI-S TaxID=3035295 RepID=UPI0021DB3459|nr:type IV pilin protein [Pseudomonas sp. RIT-PI-S]
MNKSSKGFSLMELMIAVAIVGILSAIAYPSYMNYVRKSHRAEIAQLLVEAAQNMERYYSRSGGVYTAKSGVTEPNIPTGNAWYNLVLARQDQTFTITATPVNNTLMANDVCGSFIINNTGQRTNSTLPAGTTTAFCWGR